MRFRLRTRVMGTFLIPCLVFLVFGVAWQYSLEAHHMTFHDMAGRAQRHDYLVGANLGVQRLFWLLEEARQGDAGSARRARILSGQVQDKLTGLLKFTWPREEQTKLNQAVAESARLRQEVISKLGQVGSLQKANLDAPRRMLAADLDALRQADTASLWAQWQGMENAQRRSGLLFNACLVVVLLATICISYFLARSVTRPIEQMDRATQAISEGDLSVRVSVGARDELGQLAERFNFMVDELQTLFESTVVALAASVDAKSPWTKGHSERVTNYALDIGQQLDLDSKTMGILKISGLLHDVGKIGVPDVILDKPDKLSEEEYEIVKKHPVHGYNIIRSVRHLEPMLDGIRHHHERYDGKGYPDGIEGEAIPYLARVLAVADAFDAMTSDRPYRPGMPEEKALRIMAEDDGRQWDVDVVDAFMRTRDPRLSRVTRPSDTLQLPVMVKGLSIGSAARAAG